MIGKTPAFLHADDTVPKADNWTKIRDAALKEYSTSQNLFIFSSFSPSFELSKFIHGSGAEGNKTKEKKLFIRQSQCGFFILFPLSLAGRQR